MIRAVRLLLVEDDAADARLVRDMLAVVTTARYSVTHVERLSEAQAALAREPVDVVLLDLGLADSSGLQSLVGLRAWTLAVPVIVLTGSDDESAGPSALHLGAEDFIRKHELQPALISRAIEYAIDRHVVRGELRDSGARLTGILNSVSDGIISIDDQLRVILVNPAAEQMFGRPAAELVGRPLDALLPRGVRDLHPAYIAEFARTGVTRRPMHYGTVTGVRADGALFPVEASISQVVVNGRPIFTAILRDVTERRRMEQSLQESEATNRVLFQSLADGVFVAQEACFAFANQALSTMLGYEAAEFLGIPFQRVVAPEFLEMWMDRYTKRIGEGPEPSGHYEVQFLRKDGERLWLELRATRFRWLGRPAVLGILRDISERHAADERLRQSEERFRQVMESVSEVVWLTDIAKSQMLYVSPAYEAVWGRTCASLQDSPQDWIDAIHPDDRDRVLQDATTRQVSGDYDVEYRIVRPDGQQRWIRDRAFPVHDSRGRPVRIAGVAEDITDRRRLEEQVRHTQKMESIGQLAGGVAHDFNNWLTVIFGYAEVLAERIGEDEYSTQALAEIRRAGERAASLTRQLLAFSRKEVLQPRVHDLNVIVRDTEKILERVLGEDVSARFQLAPQPLRALVDFSQWVQVLMNLAINARDAMPLGGRLIVETRAVTLQPAAIASHPILSPGDYGELTVRDTGAGMAPDVVARAFEPYFTTKGVGKGTGLGLSVVHGIVEQSRGAIAIDSQPGAGTTVRILVPLAAAAELRDADASTDRRLNGHETILFVEDEASLRRIAVHGLRAQGYTVVEAADGREAIGILHGRRDIDLLLTDVVMPEVGGRQVAELAASLYPDIKVLYMTGYTNDAVVRHGLLEEGVNLLHKPYTPDGLYRAVREALERD